MSSPIVFKLLSESATLPTKAHLGDCGYDLYASVAQTIDAGSHALIKTDVSVKFPGPPLEGLSVYGRIAPRSGMSLKKATDVGGGVIDAGFDGGLGVILFNHGKDILRINIGDKVAQLIVELCLIPRIMVDYNDGNAPVEVAGEESTSRGDRGFGSSGN